MGVPSVNRLDRQVWKGRNRTRFGNKTIRVRSGRWIDESATKEKKIINSFRSSCRKAIVNLGMSILFERA